MVGFGWRRDQSERMKDGQIGMIQLKADEARVASVAETHHCERLQAAVS